LADRSRSNATQVYHKIREEMIIAIVRGIAPSTVVSIAEALHSGGVHLVEVTCNTPGAVEMIGEVSRAMSDRMIVGAGTVITEDMARRVHQAGAKYVIAPDVNPDVIRYCTNHDIAVIPGAATATEVLTAHRLGVPMVKIFPAAALGVDYIEQLRGPIDNVDFIAVGGITAGNVGDFIRAGCAGAGLGGSLIKKDLVANSDWAGLTELAQKVRTAATLCA